MMGRVGRRVRPASMGQGFRGREGGRGEYGCGWIETES